MSELISLDAGSIEDVAVLSDSYEYDKDAEDHKGAYLGKNITYWCESCGNPHTLGLTINGVRYKGSASWEWNGRVDAGLTLGPSQLNRSYRYPHDGSDADKAEYQSLARNFDVMVQSRFRDICHTFIGINGAPPGHIIWLADCFHDRQPAPLCGQVRKLLPRKDWPGETHGRFWAKIARKAQADPEPPANPNSSVG